MASPKFVAPPINPAIAAEEGALDEFILEALEGVGLLLTE